MSGAPAIFLDRDGVKVAFVGCTSLMLPGTHAGRRVPGVAPLRSRKNCFTILSSRLWKVTTTSRPPSFKMRSAATSPSRSSSSSRLI